MVTTGICYLFCVNFSQSKIYMKNTVLSRNFHCKHNKEFVYEMCFKIYEST